MFNAFLLLVFLTMSPEDGVTVVLGAGQAWYDQEKSAVQQIEGILDYTPATGRVGIPAGYHPFRLIRRDKATEKVISQPVHAPGQEAILALNVGQRVKVDAKLVERVDGAAKTQELWLGKLTALGAAPPNAYTEMKPLARTNRFMPRTSQVRNEISTQILRSGTEVARALDMNGPGADREATTILATMMGVKNIDWKKEMVIHLGMLYTRGSMTLTNKLEVSHLEVNDRGVTVFWKIDQQRGGRANPVALAETILVPKIEGEVTFKKIEEKEETPAKDVPAKGIPEKDKPPVKPAVPEKR
jgi:hypothetical protein